MKHLTLGVAAALLLLAAGPVVAEESQQPPPSPEAVPEPEAEAPEGEEPSAQPGPEPEPEPGARSPEGEEPEAAPEPGAPAPEGEEPSLEAEPEPVPESEPEPAPEAVLEPEPEPEPLPVAVPEGPTTVPPALEEREAEPGATPPSETEGGTRQRLGSEMAWNNSLPFRNTSITYENIFNAYQLSRDSELTYNPYYAMSLTLAPRWYFTEKLSLRLRLDIETELTNSDSTTDYHETRLGDLGLALIYDPIVRIPVVGISVGAGLRLSFPTSPGSQAESRFLGLGPELRLARVFPVLDGLIVAYSGRYMKYLNRYTTLQRETNPYDCTRADPTCLSHAQLGDPAASHRFVNTVIVGLDFLSDIWRPMSFAIMVAFFNTLSYDVPESTVELMGGHEVAVGHIDDPVNHSAAIWYIFELGLEVTDYLSVAVGTSTLSAQLQPDSTYRRPFFNRDTRLYVDLSLDVERLVAVFRH